MTYTTVAEKGPRRYKGSFKDGRFNGPGKLLDWNGSMSNGEFINGELGKSVASKQFG
jgi:hypothetical protein